MQNPHVELLRDHAAIEVLARRLSQLIDTGAEAGELATALDRLIRVVAGHLEVEEEILYSDALASRGRDAQEISRISETFHRLRDDWGGYLKSWSAEEISRDRAGFIKATKAMLPRLRDRVRLETELLILLGAPKGP
jgi:hypothetical protein